MPSRDLTIGYEPGQRICGYVSAHPDDAATVICVRLDGECDEHPQVSVSEALDPANDPEWHDRFERAPDHSGSRPADDHAAAVQRFVARMRTHREQRGISRRDVATEVGLSTTAIKAIENGEQGVSLRVAAAIADAFDVPLGEMLADDVVMSDGVAEPLEPYTAHAAHFDAACGLLAQAAGHLERDEYGSPAEHAFVQAQMATAQATLANAATTRELIGVVQEAVNALLRALTGQDDLQAKLAEAVRRKANYNLPDDGLNTLRHHDEPPSAAEYLAASQAQGTLAPDADAIQQIRADISEWRGWQRDRLITALRETLDQRDHYATGCSDLTALVRQFAIAGWRALGDRIDGRELLRLAIDRAAELGIQPTGEDDD